MLNMPIFINLKQTLIHIPAIVKPQINKTNEEIIQAHGTAILNIFSMISYKYKNYRFVMIKC
jgi:hypothetical protein